MKHRTPESALTLFAACVAVTYCAAHALLTPWASVAYAPAPAPAPVAASEAPSAPVLDAERFEWFEVLEALRVCETGGQPRQGLGAVGDGGKSVGPFQIGVLYYRDATARDYPEAPVGGIAYEDLRDDRWASEAIVLAYMRRWAPEEFRRLEDGTATLEDAERVARLHNGGPTLSKTSATDGYAEKFRAYLLGL